MSDKKNLRCKLWIHKWGSTWHVTGGGKVEMMPGMISDFWHGYHVCERCGARKFKGGFVHSQLK